MKKTMPIWYPILYMRFVGLMEEVRKFKYMSTQCRLPKYYLYFKKNNNVGVNLCGGAGRCICWKYKMAEIGMIWSKKIRSWSKIRSWCDRGSFFRKITDHDLIWLEITFYDGLIEKPDHFPDHFSSICHYLKRQFGNNFQNFF